MPCPGGTGGAVVVEAQRVLEAARPRLTLEGFDFEVLLEAELAELAPDPGLLVAAEGGQGVEASPVDLDLPGPQPPGHLLGMILVAGPHTTGEAVHGVVGDLDGLFL